MELCAVEVTEVNNPNLGQCEDPAIYFPPSTNGMQMFT
jgi:hypothetical protein